MLSRTKKTFGLIAVSLTLSTAIPIAAFAEADCKLIFRGNFDVKAGKGYIGDYKAKVKGSDVIIRWRNQDIKLADNGIIFTMTGRRMGSYKCGGKKLNKIVAGKES